MAAGGSKQSSRRQGGRWAAFGAGWSATFLVWLALALATGSDGSVALFAGLPLSAFEAALCLSAEYLCRLFPLGPARLARALGNQLATAIALGAIWALAARGTGWALVHLHLGRTGGLLFEPGLVLIAGVLLYGIFAAAFYALQAAARAAEAQHEAEHAQLLARDAELRALRAQINPHFLFNSLHSISALTSLDASRARDMCIHLAELFRLTAQLARQEMIGLDEELAVLRAYLAVEQVRFGSRLGFQEEIDPAGLECRLPALLLQPLVENAVKHGIAGLTGPGYLRLRARRRGGMLAIELDNDYDPEAPAPAANGLGLENVRQRLATRYGGAASFDWHAAAGRFHVALSLPALDPAPHP